MTQLIPPASSPNSSSTHPELQSASPKPVDLLILGAGWLSQFLLPLLSQHNIPHAATTTTGRDGTIPFKFDPTSPVSLEPYRKLPPAKTILITFPLPVLPSHDTTTITASNSAAKILLDAYAQTHPSTPQPHYLLLGSTGEWKSPGWQDRHSPPSDQPSARWQSETQFLSLGGCVLHLAGLWGANPRTGRIWELAVPKTKDGVKGKGGVHFIHGMDVARAVLGVHLRAHEKAGKVEQESDKRSMWEKNGKGQRWIVTDGRTYDWWTLIWENAAHLDKRFDEEGVYRRWVLECTREEGVRGLPRDGERLGRRMDSREFWETWEIVPVEKGFSWPEDDDREKASL